MRLKLPTTPDWEVKRPFVCFGKGFGALALLFVVFTPLVALADSRVSPWVFLLGGQAYSAFLAFFGTGIGLLPKLTRSRVMTGMILTLVFGLLCQGAILVSLFFFRSIAAVRMISQPLTWFLGALLAVGIALALYGWYHWLVRGRSKD